MISINDLVQRKYMDNSPIGRVKAIDGVHVLVQWPHGCHLTVEWQVRVVGSTEKKMALRDEVLRRERDGMLLVQREGVCV